MTCLVTNLLPISEIPLERSTRTDPRFHSRFFRFMEIHALYLARECCEDTFRDSCVRTRPRYVRQRKKKEREPFDTSNKLLIVSSIRSKRGTRVILNHISHDISRDPRG